MAVPETILAILRQGPAHGYGIKHEHDAWFPEGRLLAYGQVYSTLARLERDGYVTVAETQAGGGPERTLYALTEAGERRIAVWLGEPADTGVPDEVVRKTIAALRSGADPVSYLGVQRTAHLRRIRELSQEVPANDPARLARDHLIAHLDADLRWLDLAVERTAAARP